jgi:hypothetical protein
MDEETSQLGDMNTGLFGAAETYYSRRQGKTNARTPPVLEGILPPTAAQEVGRARQNGNQNIRSALRSETGLRFASGQARESQDQGDAFTGVSIDVVDGVSEPLADIARDYPDAIAWWILLNRPRLEAAGDGLHALEQRIPEIARSPSGRQLLEGDADAVARSRDLIRRLLADEIDRPIMERIRTIERDWLGAYFFRQHRIELYAPAIALCSVRFSVPIEDMAIVVLTHELAHSFTHIGRDIDGRIWATEDFAKSDAFLVEGLAQFYTDRVCDRLAGRRPAVRRAFDVLNENQSSPYCEFQKWKKVGPYVGEAVRQTLIDCRVSGIKDHLTFHSALKTAHKRLTTAQRDFL